MYIYIWNIFTFLRCANLLRCDASCWHLFSPEFSSLLISDLCSVENCEFRASYCLTAACQSIIMEWKGIFRCFFLILVCVLGSKVLCATYIHSAYIAQHAVLSLSPVLRAPASVFSLHDVECVNVASGVRRVLGAAVDDFTMDQNQPTCTISE